MMRAGIVVPTLGGRPELLAECLASLAGQPSETVRTVLVTTAEAVDRIARVFPRTPVLAQGGTGIADAITTGWRYFGDQVDALAWLGDDDRLPRGSLSTALAELERHPNSVMVYGRSRYIHADGAFKALVRPGRIGPCLLRMGHNLVQQPGCLYRRTAVEAIGGLDHRLRLAFDVDLHRRLLAYGRARYVPVVLGEIRSHPGSLTVRNRAESLREAELAIMRQLPAWASRTRPLWHPASRTLMRVTARVCGR
jgi:GT2 family glycosyltransferase